MWYPGEIRNIVLFLAFILFIIACAIKGVYHQVKRGETLSQIAYAYNVDLIELTMINGIENPDKIGEGHLLFIPRAQKKKNVLASVKKNYYRGPIKETEEGRKQDFSPVKSRFSWPVKGNIDSQFGTRGGVRHQGIDISAPSGTPILASDNGEVIYSDKLKDYGNLIIIKHSGGYATVYAHNQINLVKIGDRVKKGQVIARVGSTGNASGPHLHFEIRYQNVARDPLLFLPP